MFVRTSVVSVLFLSGALTLPAAARQYHMSDTYILPSAVSYTMTNPMGERHGGSSIQWEEAALTIPFADPRRSGWDGWYVNVAADITLTHLSTGGDLQLPHENLTELSLPLTLIHPPDNGHRLILGAAPHLASDFAGSAHNFTVGAFADYLLLDTEPLSCSLGLAYTPNATSWVVVPFATFTWKPAEDWTVELKGARLTALRELGSGVAFGLIVKGTGGAWAIHGENGTRLFRVRSLALGPRPEWDFSKEGQLKRLLFAELGTTLFTTTQQFRYHHMNHTEETHHYHPGLYLSAGVDFRF